MYYQESTLASLYILQVTENTVRFGFKVEVTTWVGTVQRKGWDQAFSLNGNGQGQGRGSQSFE